MHFSFQLKIKQSRSLSGWGDKNK